jgi:Protein of unknown function (DUF2505)
MQVHVKHTLKHDLSEAFEACTGKDTLESTYEQLGGENIRIKRSGRAPKVSLAITRRMPANAPAAIRRFVPEMNEVSHTEEWAHEGKGYQADIVVEIKGVPVHIAGTKALRPDKAGCVIEWNFEVTSKVLLVGGLLASFAAEQLKDMLEHEFRILKKDLAAT